MNEQVVSMSPEGNLESEYAELERRLAERPGVQAVMDAYALAQPAAKQFDDYMQALTRPVPTAITSNSTA